MTKDIEIPLEVVILIIGGMALLITGVLLFFVSKGMLPYYENGISGLLLVIFSLQIITLGKTPFGDMPRSVVLLTIGVIIATIGIVACFIPVFVKLPRMLLLLCLGPGGLIMLVRMFTDKDRFQLWERYGGIFNHLIFGCSAVYMLSMLVSALLVMEGFITIPKKAVVIIIYGIAVLYVAGVLRKIYAMYPDSKNQRNKDKDVGLSTEQSMLLLVGVFMVILGVLLIPVSIGALPFSAGAQLGLLMIILAIQMLASGNTPIGPFPRSRLMILLGLIFAASGIISCIIPYVLVSTLTVLVGVLNILGGAITLIKIFIPYLKNSDKFHGSIHPVLKKLFMMQLIMNLLTILFGVSMLIPHLIPGLIIGVILAANGCALLYLLHILIILDCMQRMTEPASSSTNNNI